MTRTINVLIVGAGAAGLMAAIWAGRTQANRSIVVLDGASKIGAKILVAGGGRCNVTHDEVDVSAYAGSSPNAIKKVLRRFDVPETTAFFQDLGVELKREESGKLFPITDSARTVLDALLKAVKQCGGEIQNSSRVQQIEKLSNGFRVVNDNNHETLCENLVLATGGRSLPKTGSDGHGYTLVKALGHTITHRIFPALVPLTLPKDHFICHLSGITLQTTLQLYSGAGKKLKAFQDSTLCTHFGLSGPSVLDFSRYYINALLDDPSAYATISWLPEVTTEAFERDIQGLKQGTIFRYLTRELPERLAQALCAQAGVDPRMKGHQLTRESRKMLATVVTNLRLPTMGNRGYTYAEVTAGGVPLSEIHLDTMESRVCPGLYLCGELCDVDGRIGGYNFQWAWSSGYVAGVSVGL